MAVQQTPSQRTRLAAAAGLALLGATLAWFVVPTLQRSDALLRDGTRATATVVSVEDTTCHYSRFRGSESFPCDAVTGEWRHDAITYRTVIGHHKRPHAFTPGRQVTVVFVPDPAAAAGRAGLYFRVYGLDGAEPVSERPVYLGLLALACLLCLPFFRMLLHVLRGATA